jgi:hypothetical protein
VKFNKPLWRLACSGVVVMWCGEVERGDAEVEMSFVGGVWVWGCGRQ